MSNYEELEKLAKLKEQGVLSDEEFQIEKKKILEGSVGNNINYKLHLTYYEKKGTFSEYFLISKGRFNRLDFFISIIGIFIYMMVMVLIIGFLMNTGILETKERLLLIIIMFFSFSFIYLLYIVNIKRLHDMNISGWFSIIVAIFTPISTLFLLLIPGTDGDNRFGPKSTK